MCIRDRDNIFKMQTFFSRQFYDIALRFAKNQGYDRSLLAEIQRLHGDYYYTRGDFENAVRHYKETAGFIEPSYIVRKFLDISQIDYLVTYLEDLHTRKLDDKKIADENHTALLLNCYVKQKAIDKLDHFLSTNTCESDLFDTETAVKVCREKGYLDLAIKLAFQCRAHDQYLRIIIENKHDYKKALEYLRYSMGVRGKIKYMLEFGEMLMKNEPELTTEMLIYLVSLNNLANERNGSVMLNFNRTCLLYTSPSPRDS
eukprot:TRINITY_DN2412_c0_g1_i2.p1 TRINITY_DN2412_c0_g1~~TRINITY_DN2412_c0_g1_i2.p1  ORF type:complete len:258 (-),score=32.61 TRINITY_DN2412_c0_g1_i2:37-810(-)